MALEAINICEHPTFNSTTLPKYKRTLEHHLDNHRCANLNLHKQPSEEVYEYVDPDATAATNPPLSSEVDADGYLLPQP